MATHRSRSGDAQRELQEAIKKLIVERGLHSGSPLPTETELMRLLSVSRHPLREAVKALQALGIVEIRHGLGTFVSAPSLAFLEAGLVFRTDLALGSDLKEIRDLVQVREVIEVGLVRQVMALHRRADFGTLEEAVATMERQAESGLTAPDSDWQFHKTLYQPLGNEFVSELLRVFWSVFNRMDARLTHTDESPVHVARRHREILTALHDGDEQAMTLAVAEHFKGIDGRIALTATETADG